MKYIHHLLVLISIFRFIINVGFQELDDLKLVEEVVQAIISKANFVVRHFIGYQIDFPTMDFRLVSFFAQLGPRKLRELFFITLFPLEIYLEYFHKQVLMVLLHWAYPIYQILTLEMIINAKVVPIHCSKDGSATLVDFQKFLFEQRLQAPVSYYYCP